MELILVRHGEPRWADASRSAVRDPGLTDRGRHQAEAAARAVGRFGPVDELLVSTATRTLETVEPIARHLDLEPDVQPWLHEIVTPPDWDGTPAEEVEHVLRTSRARPLDHWWDGLDGGESFHDFHERVCTGLDAALEERGVVAHPDDPERLWDVDPRSERIVMVAHRGTNSVIVSHLLGIEPAPWEWERFASDHASITLMRTVRIAGGHLWSLQLFSDVGHLAAADVTA